MNLGIPLWVIVTVVIFGWNLGRYLGKFHHKLKNPTNDGSKKVYTNEGDLDTLEFLLSHPGHWEVVFDSYEGSRLIKGANDKLNVYNFDLDITLRGVYRASWETYTSIVEKKESIRDAEKQEAREHGLTPLDDIFKQPTPPKPTNMKPSAKKVQVSSDMHVFALVDKVLNEWETDIGFLHNDRYEQQMEVYKLLKNKLNRVKKERGID